MKYTSDSAAWFSKTLSTRRCTVVLEIALASTHVVKLDFFSCDALSWYCTVWGKRAGSREMVSSGSAIACTLFPGFLRRLGPVLALIFWLLGLLELVSFVRFLFFYFSSILLFFYSSLFVLISGIFETSCSFHRVTRYPQPEPPNDRATLPVN